MCKWYFIYCATSNGNFGQTGATKRITLHQAHAAQRRAACIVLIIMEDNLGENFECLGLKSNRNNLTAGLPVECSGLRLLLSAD